MTGAMFVQQGKEVEGFAAELLKQTSKDIEVGLEKLRKDLPRYEDVVRSPTSDGNTFGKFPNKDFPYPP
jgi:hypothetical protein